MTSKTTPYTIEDLKDIMSQLRGPEGCPWDKKQTPKSLTPYAIEEAHELEDAIYNKPQSDIVDELGDLLFQVIFQSQMAQENNQFTFDDVVHRISSKMMERHPHVFAQKNNSVSAEIVMETWEQQKSKKTKPEELFDIPTNLPALITAVKIGKKSKVINFDWKAAQDVWEHIDAEINELKDAIDENDLEHIQEEVGDVLFTIAQLARKLKVDPEKSLRLSNEKIIRRIYKAHEISELSWDQFCQLKQEKKDMLWQQAKASFSSSLKPKKC